MTIVCGTDFSQWAEDAVNVAVRMARRFGTHLQLVHAIPIRAEQLHAEPKPELVRWAEQQLERETQRLAADGVRVDAHVAAGAPDDVLMEIASRVHAQMIVVGAFGHRKKGTWRLGSHADRLAQRAQVPVLVVRNAAPLTAWLDEEQPLSMMLGADQSRSTDLAMAEIERLRKVAPCEVTAVHLYWPPQQFERLGLEGVRSYLEPAPEVTENLVRELTHRLTPESKPESIRVEAYPHLGRVGDRLAAIASERGAHLLVVGSHDRGKLGRIWEGTVSRWALHAADTSVLVVPLQPLAADAAVPVPRVRNVLAATDFSPAGNAAVATAFAIAPPDAVVHLAHVVHERPQPPLAPHDVLALEQLPGSDARRDEVHALLQALVPPESRETTRLLALESNDAGHAICQAAARVEAEIVCVGHRGRSLPMGAGLGSVAKDVLARAEQAVLLARAPRD